MDDKAFTACKHVPNYHYNDSSRFCYFLLHRENCLESFTCKWCGIELGVPRILTRRGFHFVYLLVSMAITFAVFLSWKLGGVLSVLSGFWVGVTLFILVYVFYKLGLAAVYTFCTWSPAEENNKATQLKDQVSQIRTAVMIGILMSIWYLQSVPSAPIIMLISILGIPAGFLRKKPGAYWCCLAFLTYSVFSLLYFSGHLDFTVVLDGIVFFVEIALIYFLF